MRNKRGNIFVDIFAVVLVLMFITSLSLNTSSKPYREQDYITMAEEDFEHTITAVSRSLTASSFVGRTKVSVTNHIPIRGVGEDKGKFFYLEAIDPDTKTLNDYSSISVSVVNKVILAGYDIDILNSPSSGKINYLLQRRNFVNREFSPVSIPTLQVIKDGDPIPMGLTQIVPVKDKINDKPLTVGTSFLFPKDLNTFIGTITNPKFSE